MAENSNIEWTESTWNPWYGCLKISPGCKNCYMYRDMLRYGRDPKAVTRSKTKFNDPLTWVKSGNAPKFCFTCSWSDFFIEQADEWRGEAWEIIRQTPQITYQVLTKRPERIREHLPADWGEGYPNVWLGVSAENQQYADERIPLLLSTPAKVRWVSCEPLLGPIDLTRIAVKLANPRYDLGDPTHASALFDHAGDTAKLDWAVIGGESGPNARPMHPDWARSLRDQCQAAGVPFFFKQWGEWMPVFHGINPSKNDPKCRVHDGFTFPAKEGQEHGQHMWKVGKKAAGRLLDGKEHSEYPEAHAH